VKPVVRHSNLTRRLQHAVVEELAHVVEHERGEPRFSEVISKRDE